PDIHVVFFFSSRRRHTRWPRDWSSDVCSSDLVPVYSCLRLSVNESLSRKIVSSLPPMRELSFADLSYVSRRKVRGGVRNEAACKIGRASCREKWRCGWWEYHDDIDKEMSSE